MGSKDNKENSNTNDTSNNKDNKEIKIVVSSLKKDDNKPNGLDTNNIENVKKLGDVNNKDNNFNNANNLNNLNKDKVGFFKTFYYSTIRLDKLPLSIESSTSWIKYIFIFLILLSVIMGFFLGQAMFTKVENFKVQINELPDLTYRNGKLEGDFDVNFSDLDGERLIIINTIDSVFDIRDKYKEEIDKVAQYILLTKDTIYVEPGESLEYAELNMLADKTITKIDVIDIVDSLFQNNFIVYISGFLASVIILSFIAILAFVLGRFIITILTIYGIKSYDLKKINKMAIFLTTMPFIIYVFLTVLNMLNILKFKINNLLVFIIIYLAYIIITIQIIKKKSSGVTVIRNIEDLTEVLDDIAGHTMDDLENEKKQKREEKRKLKEKQKKDKEKARKEEKEKKEIVEGV